MSNQSKNEDPGENKTTGKDGATTSIEQGEEARDSTNRLDGQQGTGGLGEVGERTTPTPTGSQPHLGGAEAPQRGGPPGTGLTEDSDPASRGSMPDLADPRSPRAGQAHSRNDS